MPNPLTDLDRRLMEELQLNAARPASQLASKLSVSTSTVHRRIVELRSAGVITGVVAVASPKAARRDMVFVVMARLSTSKEDELEALERWAQGNPAVQQALLMPDDPGMMLIVRVGTLDQFNAWLQALQADNPVVSEVSARVALKTIKQTLYVPFGGD